MIALAVLLILPSNAIAQRPSDAVPYELEGVGITERLNEKAPLDVTFTDDNGNTVRFGDYFKAGKPVILTLNYFRCPQLCDLTLNALVDGLQEVEWSAGKEFQIVTVSFNPSETTKLANTKKRAYLTEYTREGAKDGWHFLTGTQENIDRLTNGVGFGYKKQDNGEYAHTATIIFLTPEGVISRYFNELTYKPSDLRLALIESSQGKIGSLLDRTLLFNCFMFDPERGYVPSAWKIMRAGGVLTMLIVAIGLFVLWRRGSHAGHPSPESSAVAADTRAAPSSASPFHPVPSGPTTQVADS